MLARVTAVTQVRQLRNTISTRNWHHFGYGGSLDREAIFLISLISLFVNEFVTSFGWIIWRQFGGGGEGKEKPPNKADV